MLRSYVRFVVLAVTTATIGLAALGAASASADPSLVGWWQFNEGSGPTANDSSGNGNAGTLSGGVDWVAGAPGVSPYALSFDGTTGSVDVPDSSVLEPNALTVQTWVKRAGSPGKYIYIVDKGYDACLQGSYGLYSGSAGGLEFYVADGLADNDDATSPDAGTGIWNGSWQLVTGTYDGSTLRLYVDGVQVGSGTPWTNPIQYGLPQSNDLFFGSYMGCAGLDYPGAMDDVQIWNRALSPTEIAAEDPTTSLALSPSSSSVTYGTAQTYTATALDAQGNSQGSVTPATTFTIAPDGTCTNASCTPAAPGSHTVTGTDGSATGTAALTVAPAALTVTANNATRAFGAANPTLGATITGFVDGQNLASSGVTGAPACTTTATTSSAPGTYPITCTQGTLGATDYSFPASNFVAGTLTVSQSTSALTAPPISVLNSLLALTPTFTATLTSRSTGMPIVGQTVSFALSAAPKVTVCSQTTNSAGVAMCKPGMLSLLTLLLSSSYTASYAGNAGYSAITATGPVVLIAVNGKVIINAKRLTQRERTLLKHDLKQCASVERKGSHAARKVLLHGPRCEASKLH